MAGLVGAARRRLRPRGRADRRQQGPPGLHRHGQKRPGAQEDRRHPGVDRHAVVFLHPAEAIHGDLGMIVQGDVVLAASYSGTTEELVRLVEIVKRLGVPLVAITGNPEEPAGPPRRHPPAHRDQGRGLPRSAWRRPLRPPPPWRSATRSPWRFRGARLHQRGLRPPPSGRPAGQDGCCGARADAEGRRPAPGGAGHAAARGDLRDVEKGLGITADHRAGRASCSAASRTATCAACSSRATPSSRSRSSS